MRTLGAFAEGPEMALLATLYDSRRSDERQAADVGATIRVDGSPVDALIVNLSASGCLFVCSEPFEVGDTMSIGIAGVGRRPARIVRALGSRFGAEFAEPLTVVELRTAVSASDESVIAFPLVTPVSSDIEKTALHYEKYSYRVRQGIIASLVVTSWMMLFIARGMMLTIAK